jgi:hypothetical protein
MTAANSVTTLTAAELSSRLGFDQKLVPLVDTLIKINPFFSMLLAMDGWVDCNQNTEFRGRRTSTEPTWSARDYDEGVAPSVSSQEPYTEPTETLGDWFKMDLTRLYDIKPSQRERLVSEELASHWRGGLNTVADHVFYGNRNATPNIIRGLTYRPAFNTLSSAQVLDTAGGSASGTKNKTSVWVMKVGPQGYQCITPENDDRLMTGEAVQGFSDRMADLGGIGFFIKNYGDSVPLSDGTNLYPGKQTYMEIRVGQAVHNPEAIFRIGNISTTEVDEIDDFSFDPDDLIRAVTRVGKATGGTDNILIIMPTIVSEQIWIDINHKGNVYHTMTDPYGRRIAAFDNHPICICDAIVSTEATLS